MSFGDDLQVRPVQHGAQESARRAPAPAALLVHLEIGAAEVVAAVEGGNAGNAALGGGLAPGVDDVPAHARVLDPDLAALTVEVLGTVLERLEDVQDVVPRPTAVTERGPVVPVLLLAAHVDHGVDRGAAAE